MTLDLGDEADTGSATSIPLPSDGSGSAGDFVTFNSSGNVTDAANADDDIIGVLAEDSPSSSGDPVTVWIDGAVVGNVGSSVSAGDVLEPDGSNAGRATSNGDGRRRSVDEGGTATYDLAQGNPQAYSDAGGAWPPGQGNSLGSNEAVVFISS